MRFLILICFFVTVTLASYHRPQPYLATLGARVEMRITDSEKVQFITRKLKTGEEQKFHVDGPSKNHWVDAAGKKIDSSNYEFKAPGIIIIKKMEKSDVGVYDYVPLVKTTPPPAHHVDIAMVGYDLQIL